MKRCPECQRDYYDDTLSYCLNDGTELVYGLSPEEPATAILHSTAAPGEAPTRAQIHTTEQTIDKRLLAAPFLLAIIALGGFFSNSNEGSARGIYENGPVHGSLAGRPAL